MKTKNINIKLFHYGNIDAATCFLEEMINKGSGAIFVYGSSMESDQSTVQGSLHVVIPSDKLFPTSTVGKTFESMTVVSISDENYVVAWTGDLHIEKALEEIYSLMEVKSVNA